MRSLTRGKSVFRHAGHGTLRSLGVASSVVAAILKVNFGRAGLFLSNCFSSVSKKGKQRDDLYKDRK